MGVRITGTHRGVPYCRKCGKTFVHQFLLDAHVRRQHPPKEGR